MKRFLIPLGIFLVLVVFLAIGLNRDPHEVPSPLVGKPAMLFAVYFGGLLFTWQTARIDGRPLIRALADYTFFLFLSSAVYSFVFDAAPLIIFSPDGAPFLTIGSAGGSGIPGYVLQRVIAMIDWKQDLVSALAAPNVINRGREIEMEEGAASMAEALKAKGHPVKTVGLVSGLTAISFSNGLMTGVADSRREGSAMGE